MAIYGMNFNNTQIPERAKALFPARVRVRHGKVLFANGKYGDLKGVCQTEEETVLMTQAASRPGRLLAFVYREGWFGCYVASE